jgi:hypothetical protein
MLGKRCTTKQHPSPMLSFYLDVCIYDNEGDDSAFFFTVFVMSILFWNQDNVGFTELNWE